MSGFESTYGREFKLAKVGGMPALVSAVQAEPEDVSWPLLAGRFETYLTRTHLSSSYGSIRDTVGWDYFYYEYGTNYSGHLAMCVEGSDVVLLGPDGHVLFRTNPDELIGQCHFVGINDDLVVYSAPAMGAFVLVDITSLAVRIVRGRPLCTPYGVDVDRDANIVFACARRRQVIKLIAPDYSAFEVLSPIEGHPGDVVVSGGTVWFESYVDFGRSELVRLSNVRS